MTEREIFAAALDLPDAAARGAFLDRACGADSGLRDQVESLLREHGQLGSFLERPAVGHLETALADAPTAPFEAPEPGSAVGPYKLLEKVGEGGMGEVWAAEQSHPIRRRVAVKLIKPGMDSRTVLARFEAERQALALMDHPNIARVFDAGTTEAGRPYFAMELVKGVPITRFCDEHRLTPRERLGLFVPVCQAVQHAHQKGIIHRDLKPTNVLVELHDDRPVPRVIDFGVAKAVGHQLTDRTFYTRVGELVGTPAYMAPEQAAFNALDVDTRADVYALGVLLYELLAGSPPFDPDRLRKAALDEVLRIVREEEPLRPSSRLSTSDSRASIAADRRTEPRRLGLLLRGDLDWVVMKALEKDRARRYESASAFAADVQRYLADEAIQACPPSLGYQFRKFARRNKAGMVTAAVVALAVLVAVGSLTVSYVRSERSLRHEKQAKEDLVQRLYYQGVGAAAHDRAKNRHARAEELLEQCPPRLRGWEWHYVKRMPFTGALKLPHSDDIVHRVAWSPDGRLLASGSWKGRVKVWDARTGDLLFHREAHKGFVQSVTFSPDGRFLATGGNDGRVKLWDLSRSDRPVEFPTSTGTIVHALEYSPNGRYLAAAEHARKVRLWDLAGGGEVRVWDDRVAPGGLAFTPDAPHLFTVSTEGVLKVIELSSGQIVDTFHAETRATAHRVAFSRDRRLLALGCEDGTVKILRTDPMKEVRTLEAHAGEVCGLAFSAGEERLASAGEDFTLKIWDLRTGQEAFVLDIIARRANGLAFSPDGHRLAVGSGDGLVRILDGTPLGGPSDGEQLLTLVGHGHVVVWLAYSPDGGRIASASRDGTARVWNAQTGREVVTFRSHRAPLTGVAWAPDGGRVASAGWDGTARVWDPATGAEVLPALDAAAGPVYSLAFDRDGALATAHDDRSVRVWDTATGQLKVCIPEAHTQPVLGVAFSPCGEHLVSAGGKDNTIKVWDWRADPKKPLRTLTGPGILRNPVFSPDGRRLTAVAATPAQVWVWDMTTFTDGEEKEPLRPNAWKVSQAVFRPGGRLAVVSSDRVQFLEADGAEGPALVGRHAGEIGCAAFSPDGRRLATGAGYKGRGEIRIWDASQWEKAP